MKKIHTLIVAALLFTIAACTKETAVPVYTPENNVWLVNSDTFGPAVFTYYDTANVIHGGLLGKASVTISFGFKPKFDGKYVFREKADEHDEVTVLIVDSINRRSWRTTDNDGRAKKEEQFADITVSGNNVGVKFNNLFLKNINNPDMARTSINISY